MSVFQVVVRPRTDSVFEPGDAVFVRDGFSWFAALLPPVWAIAHGLWLELAGIVIAIVAISLLGRFVGGDAAFWLYVLGAALLGFEAAAIRVAALRRRGFEPAGDVIAQDRDFAEMAFIARWGHQA